MRTDTVPLVAPIGRWVFAAGFALSLLIAGTAHAQSFTATLSGSNEVPAITTSASGQVDATLEGTTLTVSGAFTGLSSPVATDVAGGAHLHGGLAGQNGGIELGLTPTLDGDGLGGTFEAVDNTFELTAEQVALLEARSLYVNIHTATYRGGELRGQLVPSDATVFRAVLSGGNAVPSNVSAGMGALLGELDGGTLTVTGAFSGLETDFDANVAGGAHLHLAYAGATGGISVSLTATPDGDLRGGVFTAADNVFALTADQITALQERRLYANIHTTGYPGGEVRGQMIPAAATGLKGVLSGSSQVPANTSTGLGAVVAELDGTTLVVTGAFRGLASDYNADVAGGAHLHTGYAGANGGIAVGLTPTLDGDARGGVFAAADNTLQLTPEQVQALLERRLYANIHTVDLPGGELRGQMVGTASAPFIALLDAGNQAPPRSTTATGAAVGELSGTRLIVTGAFRGLASDFNADVAGGAHLHEAYAGRNGGIAVGLSATTDMDLRGGVFAAADNTLELTPEQVTALQDRRLYANIHTRDLPSGELRGQMAPVSSAQLRATLSGLAEVPSVHSTGRGAALVELRGGTEAVVTGAFSDLTSDFDAEVAGGAHLHQAALDANGGIEVGLNADVGGDLRGGVFAAADNTFDLTGDQVDALLGERLYVNIHTQAFGGGELRGQVLEPTDDVFEATLSGRNHLPPVATGASGGLLAVLDGTTLQVKGDFGGLESDFNADVAGGAHLHQGAPDGSGGIVLGLDATLDGDLRGGTFAVADNTFELTSEQVDLVRGAMLYGNVHTQDQGSGEIRGQLLVSTNVAPTAAALESPEDGAMLTITGDPETPFVAAWAGASDANGNDVFYRWQLATDADFQTVLLEGDLGAATTFETTYGDVAALLTDAGVELDGTVTLYHRVESSDGAKRTAGEAFTVELTRGTITDVEGPGEVPATFRVDGTYPNPFNPTTTLRFDLPEAAEVRVEVFDVLGRQVLTLPTRPLAAGFGQAVEIDASALPSGLYLYRLVAQTAGDALVATGPMVLLK